LHLPDAERLTWAALEKTMVSYQSAPGRPKHSEAPSGGSERSERGGDDQSAPGREGSERGGGLDLSRSESR
jgi:hypothetical protein